MNPVIQQHEQVLALAYAGGQRGTAVGVGLTEALASQSQGWVSDLAMFESAKFYFRSGHFDTTIRICQKLLQDEPDATAWRGRLLRLLAGATMGNAEVDSSQISEIQGWLDEAQEICELNRDPRGLAKVLREKGALAYWKGDLEEGAQLLQVGEQLGASFAKGVPRETQNAPAIATRQ